MSKKNVTIDDLAAAVKSGFDGVDKNFEVVNKKFESINDQLKGLQKGQERIELRLTNVAYRFELVELENRVKRLETKLGLKTI